MAQEIDRSETLQGKSWQQPRRQTRPHRESVVAETRNLQATAS